MSPEQKAYIAGETGKTYRSGWLLVDQPLIQRFADTTRDWNFIHVDPEKAAQTAYGTTIAHGFLVLSLLAPLRADTDRPVFPGFSVGVNYGFERQRFIAPVRSGSRIRAAFTVDGIEEVSEGRFREAQGTVIEIEGEERPAVVATWLTMYLV